MWSQEHQSRGHRLKQTSKGRNLTFNIKPNKWSNHSQKRHQHIFLEQHLLATGGTIAEGTSTWLLQSNTHTHTQPSLPKLKQGHGPSRPSSQGQGSIIFTSTHQFPFSPLRGDFHFSSISLPLFFSASPFLLPFAPPPLRWHTCRKQTVQPDCQYHCAVCLFVPQARIWMIGMCSWLGINTNEPLVIYSSFHFTEWVFTCRQEHTHTSAETQRTAAHSLPGCQSEANNDLSALRIWSHENAEQIVRGLAIIGASSAYLLLSAISADGCWEPGLTMRWSRTSEVRRRWEYLFITVLCSLLPVFFFVKLQKSTASTHFLFLI